LHVAQIAYQKKSRKSALSHGLSWPTENRGVPGSIPGLAIGTFCHVGGSALRTTVRFAGVSELPWRSRTTALEHRQRSLVKGQAGLYRLDAAIIRASATDLKTIRADLDEAGPTGNRNRAASAR
jgi:hypothetical protein